MNIIKQKPPFTVCIGGITHDINSDFRVSIDFESLILNPVKSEKEKIALALQLYYPIIPENIEEAIKQMIWFYNGGKQEQTLKGGFKHPKQIYSFEHDDTYIYAAFLDQYGIDLQDVEYLHWWKFKALFQALKEDNEIVKIMGYRAMTIDSKMSKEQQRFYRQMQEKYRIPIEKSERDKLNAVEEALLKGEDISRLL